MNESNLMERITYNPKIFGGKAIIRGRRLAVEHVLGMLATGHTTEGVLADFPWLEPDDIRACLLYAKRAVGEEAVGVPAGVVRAGWAGPWRGGERV